MKYYLISMILFLCLFATLSSFIGIVNGVSIPEIYQVTYPKDALGVWEQTMEIIIMYSCMLAIRNTIKGNRT